MQPFVKEIWDVKALAFLDVIKIQRSVFHMQDIHHIYKVTFKQTCLKRLQKTMTHKVTQLSSEVFSLPSQL